jgi:hypothetical protein
MTYKKILMVVLLAACLSSCRRNTLRPPVELSIPSMDAAFERCAGTKIGRDYIESVSLTFLKAVNFDSCILKGDPDHKPIAIYFVVDAVGKIGDINIRPTDVLSYCIKENVAKLSLPPPPTSECLIRILLSFEGDDSDQPDDEATP